MKKLIQLFICFTALFILTLSLVGCGGEPVEKYTVTYTVDGSKYDEKTFEVGASPTLPEAPEKSGYVLTAGL